MPIAVGCALTQNVTTPVFAAVGQVMALLPIRFKWPSLFRMMTAVRLPSAFWGLLILQVSLIRAFWARRGAVFWRACPCSQSAASVLSASSTDGSPPSTWAAAPSTRAAAAATKYSAARSPRASPWAARIIR